MAKKKREYQPQPDCPHCGGLHFGQRFDDCPYPPEKAAALKAQISVVTNG